MRVAIVDDLRVDAEALRDLLNAMLPISTFVDIFDSGEAFLASTIKYDLIFLDIIMDGVDGVETARRIRVRDIGCLIVFLTTSSEYAWDAFPVHPFDYLIKPVDKMRLARVLNEAERALERRQQSLSVKVGRQQVTIVISAVSYACARDHFVFIMLTDGRELRCYMKFSQLQAMLEGESRFLVCNRGVLINMDEVRSFDGDCFTMNDMRRFPVRLHEKARIGDKFYQYTFRKARGVE